MRLLDDDAAAEGRYQAIATVPVGVATLGALVAALHDESWRVRRLAAEKLGAATSDVSVVIDALVEVLSERGSPGARNAAATALGRLGVPAVSRLISLLREADADRRKFAAEILGEIGAPISVAALRGALSDVDANVRAAAGESLARVGGPEAVVALGELLRATEPLLRVVGLEGLASLGAPPSLCDVSVHLDDSTTRDSALRLIGFIAHPTAELVLCRALGSASTRQVALEALGARTQRLSREAEVPLRAIVHGIESLTWLEAALRSEQSTARRGALRVALVIADARLAPAIAAASTGTEVELGQRALLKLGTAGAVALLDGDVPCVVSLAPEARAAVEEVMVQFVSPALVELLTRHLHSGDGELAELAVTLLGHTHAEQAISVVIDVLDDGVLGAAAARALVTLGHTFPTQVEGALASRVAGQLGESSLRAWAVLKGPLALEALRRAAHDQSASLRALAAELAPLLGKPGEAIVRAALMDETELVRIGACRALGKLERKAGQTLLTQALRDARPHVLVPACQAAVALQAVAEVPRLEQLAQHADGSVALAAFEALAWLGQGDRPAVLEAALRHPDAEVLKAALRLTAQRQLTRAAAVTALTHAKWDVRAAAARALAVSGDAAGLSAVREALDVEQDALTREAFTAAISSLEERVTPKA